MLLDEVREHVLQVLVRVVDERCQDGVGAHLLPEDDEEIADGDEAFLLDGVTAVQEKLRTGSDYLAGPLTELKHFRLGK